jgi:carboxypeptidase C (cathepsin A)
MKKMTMTKRQQFWLAHIQAAMRCGEQMQRYAKRHGLSVAALYNAKSVFKHAGLLKSAPTEVSSSAFVPVQIARPVQPLMRCRLQHTSGWQLEMERLPDAKWLRDVIGDRDAAT